MESALAWIGQIAEWLGRFIPRLVLLDPTMGGVKHMAHLWGDQDLTSVACGPGFHVYFPLLTQWDTYPTAGQTDDLRSQIITTADGRTVAVGGMVTYEVTDILRLLTSRFSPQRAVRDICLTAIHDACCAMTWEALRLEQQKGTLGTKLKNEARKQLDKIGVNVLKLQLTDLAPARVLKVIQAVGKDED